MPREATGRSRRRQSATQSLLRPTTRPTCIKPWGGAGAQRVFGAWTTGTHGGDFLTGPIADSVMALHRGADGGKHYWIEPESTRLGPPRLTDDAALKALYGQPRYAGPNRHPN